MIRDRRVSRHVLVLSAVALFPAAIAAFPAAARSQDVPLGQAPAAADQALRQGTDLAPVTVDGHELFPVRGIRAYPAERRAAEIASRIREAARDPAVQTSDMRLEETADGVRILIGDHYLLTILELDADLEAASLGQISQVYSGLIAQAIDAWRAARVPSRLLRNAVFVAVGALLLIGFLFLLHRLYLALTRFAERHGAGPISVGSLQVLHPGQLRALLLWTVRVAMTVTGLVIVYAYLNAALGAFPWTRGFALSLLGHVTDPIFSIGRGILAFIPGLLFILIAWFFTRFVLRLIRTYFTGLEHGTIALRGFEPEWARPTYRLVRTFVIVLFLVMIFPYIPGSSTSAFKGISLFMGIVFSLGSSSVIGNLIAGYTMTYRRAFRVGDRILVDGSIGDVEEMRLLVTHLRSPKNEEIIVPEHADPEWERDQLQLDRSEGRADTPHHGRDRIRDAVEAGRGDASGGGAPDRRAGIGTASVRAAEGARGLRGHLRGQRLHAHSTPDVPDLHGAAREHPGRVQRVRSPDHDAGLRRRPGSTEGRAAGRCVRGACERVGRAAGRPGPVQDGRMMTAPTNEEGSAYRGMPARRLGASGVVIPRICLGCWNNFGAEADEDECKRLVFTAFDQGVTHFDLANNYGPPPGSAEERFGKILKHLPRNELVISTKAGYLMWEGPYGNWGSRKHLLASLDQSLRRLQVEYVDMFYHHRPDPETRLDESLGALDSAVRQGKALYPAISNYGAE